MLKELANEIINRVFGLNDYIVLKRGDTIREKRKKFKMRKKN